VQLYVALLFFLNPLWGLDIMSEAALNYDIFRATIPNFNSLSNAWKAYYWAKAYYRAVNGYVHTALDICGLIEFVGTPCDLTNGTFYLLENDLTNAGTSYLSAIPLLGTYISSGKVFGKVIKWNGKVRRVEWRWLNGICEFGSDGALRQGMRDILGCLPNWQAHHILPLNAQTHSVIQEAAKYADNPFHINDIANGISLPDFLGNALPRHLGSHPAYDLLMQRDLRKINDKMILEPVAGRAKYASDQLNILLNKMRNAINSGNFATINEVIW
jgi:hypothetical protein